MAAKIIVMKNNEAVEEFVLNKEYMVIGRKQACDIRIMDNAVSGVHARILQLGDKYRIEDMGSTNGVFIKGQRIQQRMLQNKDIILVGEHRLIFVEGEFEAVAPSKTRQPAQKKPVDVAPQTPTDQPAYLMILTGKDEHQQIDLTEPLTSIGKAGIQVAAISQRRQGHFIIHVDGGNDRNRVPLVNGEAIGFKSRKLEHGDKIEVAGVEMEYRLSDVNTIRVT